MRSDVGHFCLTIAIASAAAALLVDEGFARAQAPAPAGITDVSELSLEDLLNAETTVTTKVAKRSIRETPGVVTVVTREEIQRAGARDLVDVLRLVPSFQFGTDTYSSIYAGMRGLWAADGKMLILLDGHEMQELLYSTAMLGNRFPVDWIERVEVIRGPGSVIYGGSSELAVVNIVTRSAAELHGASVSGSYGQMLDGVANGGQSLGDTYSQRYLSASAGGVTEDGKLSGLVSVFGGQGNRSDRVYTDAYGGTYNMAGNSSADPLMAHLRFTAGDLSVSALVERYHTTMRDGYYENLDRPLAVNFYSTSLLAAYDWKISDSVTLTPKLRWTYQRPWITTDPHAFDYEEPYYWNTKADRVQAGLVASIDATDWLNLMLGAEYVFDYAKDEYYGFAPDRCEAIPGLPGSDPDCTTEVQYNNVAAYAQGLVTTPVVDISAGARFEYNDEFGGSFVPRGALTKAFGRFHYKALAAQAFRAPSVQNLAYSPTVTPEKTTAFELELGYRLTDFLFASVNGFFTMVDSPLVYYYDDAIEDEGYANYDKTGSAGVEAELKFKLRGHFANLSYGFYSPAGQNEVTTFAVPGHDDVLLGFAQHKLALNGGVELAKNLTFNVSGSLLFGGRYGYVGVDADGASVLEKFDPELILNANLMYRNLLTKGLFVQVGARNLTNSEIWYIQPYDNWHAPIPGSSAEVFLKIGYDTP
jgi:outer membrane receptor for ferrienterochelin and colicin